jgi:hypothetical protein
MREGGSNEVPPTDSKDVTIFQSIRRVSRADGKYTVNTRDRMLVARNGVVFIQAWLDLQLEREGSQEVRRWLEAKKTKVERQLTKLDRQIKSEERRSQRA